MTDRLRTRSPTMRLKDDILSDPTGNDVTLVDRIARLPDDNAVSALALGARRHGHTVDATTVTAVDVRVREALTQPDLQPIITPATRPLGRGCGSHRL